MGAFGLEAVGVLDSDLLPAEERANHLADDEIAQIDSFYLEEAMTYPENDTLHRTLSISEMRRCSRKAIVYCEKTNMAGAQNDL